MNKIVQLNELMRGKVFELLTIFMNFPTKEFSTKEVRKKTKMSKATLAKWLAYLVKNNFLQLKRVGATKLYKLERENVIVRYFKILINISKLQILKKLADKYRCEVFLYGSSARGEDTEKSDFDLLIISDQYKQEIMNKVIKYEKKLDRKLKTQTFTKEEWAGMGRKDPAFYERVEKDKIRIS